jgi:actin related protein 2/3 complex, subunit 5
VEADIAPAIQSLSLEQCDVLMKYIYKLMENEKSPIASLLLKLHAQLLEKAGVGSIMRVLVDRKTL